MSKYKAPFKLKSGNSPLFKQMGSSPAKLTYAEAYEKADQSLYGNLSLEEYTAEAKRQQASKKAGKGWDAPTKPMGNAENTGNVESTVPNDPNIPAMHGAVNTSKDGWFNAYTNEWVYDGTTGPESGGSAKTEPFKPLYTSREDIKLEKDARKLSGKLNRKERKYEKLASKAESALAEGKDKKAKRLAKRASKQLRKKGVRTTDEGVGLTSDRLIDLGLG